jgi:flagellar biosynthesis chaperone FliJ
MADKTTYEVEQEIKIDRKTIEQCEDKIIDCNKYIADKWAEIKDFVSGNSVEKVTEGAKFIETRKKDIKKYKAEIERKKRHIEKCESIIRFKRRESIV